MHLGFFESGKGQKEGEILGNDGGGEVGGGLRREEDERDTAGGRGRVVA
jgi:hypothetical protein